MNVAFVTSQVYPFRKGGTEKRIHEIGRRLAARGHEVTVYGCHWWDGPTVIDYEGMTLRGVSPGGEQYSGNRRSIPEALRFSGNLLKPLSNGVEHHDVLVACVSEHFPVWVSRADTVLRDTPLVTTWHEVWSYEYWRRYLGRLGVFGWTVQAVTAKLSQRPIAVSAMTADRLARIGPDRDRIRVVPNGVDVGSIRSTPPADDGFDVLFVGRLIPEKNVDLLLSAFDAVTGTYDVTLGIIGDGTEARALRREAHSMTHADRVTFLGFVDEDREVHAHMRAADLFVFPSTREGFGITGLEAMAAGCTTITVSHPDSATAEVVGEGGFVCAPSAPAIADTMGRALDGEAPRLDPVERAMQYDWERIADRAEDAYRDAT